jgi:hypothetical protein
MAFTGIWMDGIGRKTRSDIWQHGHRAESWAQWERNLVSLGMFLDIVFCVRIHV